MVKYIMAPLYNRILCCITNEECRNIKACVAVYENKLQIKMCNIDSL